MMHQPIGKKTKIYSYVVLLILFSTSFNINLSTSIKKEFRIKKIQTDGINSENFKKGYFLNKNIFLINEKKLKQALLENSSLKFFEIKKIYPDTIKIILEKSQPVAKIIMNGETLYLGDNGKLFNSEDKQNLIPTILGKIELENINRIIKLLKYSLFKIGEIKFIKIYPSKRIDLVLRDNTTLKLLLKLNQKILIEAFEIYNKKEFYQQIIDLRLDNKIILRNE